MTQFEEILAEVPVLAVLLPVVALLGGNAGAQSLAVTIRALSSDDVPRTEVGGILGRQAMIGFMNGIGIGIAAGLVAGLYVQFLGQSDPYRVGLVVAMAAFVNLVVATVSGAGIPLTFRALGLDPALASNIFLTLITDLVGFAGFLAIATALL
jgi:magnesium transporter